MTQNEIMVMELVEHFFIAGIADAGAYLRLPPDDATKAFASLAEKGYLKVRVITEADCLYVFTLEGREAAKKLPGIVNGCAQAEKRRGIE